MSGILSGLAGAAIVAAVLLVARRNPRPPKKLENGWKALRPGWMIKGTALLGLALTSFPILFLANGGSSRADADFQNFMAGVLGIAFFACAVVLCWGAWGQTICWNDDELRQRQLFGREKGGRISEVTYVTYSSVRNSYGVSFANGDRIWVSELMHGYHELLSKLPRRAFADDIS